MHTRLGRPGAASSRPASCFLHPIIRLALDDGLHAWSRVQSQDVLHGSGPDCVTPRVHSNEPAFLSATQPPFTVDCSRSSVWSTIDLRPSELEEVSDQQIHVSQAKVVSESSSPFLQDLCNTWGLTQWLSSQESTYNEGSTPGSGRSPGGGNGTPLQYFCLEIPMGGGAWWAAVHGVPNSRTRLSNFTFTFHFHALEKAMATHSSVLAWRIPGTG